MARLARQGSLGKARIAWQCADALPSASSLAKRCFLAELREPAGVRKRGQAPSAPPRSGLGAGNRLRSPEVRRRPRHVRSLERRELVVGELDVQRGDGVGEVVGLGRPDDGGVMTGFVSTQANAICAIGTPRSPATFSTAPTTAASASP